MFFFMRISLIFCYEFRVIFNVYFKTRIILSNPDPGNNSGDQDPQDFQAVVREPKINVSGSNSHCYQHNFDYSPV